MSRRRLLAQMACGTAIAQSGCRSISSGPAVQMALPPAAARRLPRWRGFNLVEKSNAPGGPFRESDFAAIAEWGFNFVRLPMDYRVWTDPSDWTRVREPALREIDDAVEFGRRYTVHVQLNFHRAPGYTVARPPEARSLWSDDDALRVCASHWRAFARRYRGVPNRQISFNLLNEPSGVDPAAHRRVVERLIEAIWEEDDGRLAICDGRDYGRTPPEELVGLEVATATRGYEPFRLTHYRAAWIAGSDQWVEPTYPRPDQSGAWDAARIRQRWIEPWRALEKQGVGVMVGEFGAFNRTPHRVVLAWMKDVLGLWRDVGWGWALWNLRGSFGLLDSDRPDVNYEKWMGHKLDRDMLALLQRF